MMTKTGKVSVCYYVSSLYHRNHRYFNHHHHRYFNQHHHYHYDVGLRDVKYLNGARFNIVTSCFTKRGNYCIVYSKFKYCKLTILVTVSFPS